MRINAAILFVLVWIGPSGCDDPTAPGAPIQSYRSSVGLNTACLLPVGGRLQC